MKHTGRAPIVTLFAAGAFTAGAFALLGRWRLEAFAPAERDILPIIWGHLCAWLALAPTLYGLSAAAGRWRATAATALLTGSATLLAPAVAMALGRRLDAPGAGLVVAAGVLIGAAVLGAVARAPVLASAQMISPSRAVALSVRRTRPGDVVTHVLAAAALFALWFDPLDLVFDLVRDVTGLRRRYIPRTLVACLATWAALWLPARRALRDALRPAGWARRDADTSRFDWRRMGAHIDRRVALRGALVALPGVLLAIATDPIKAMPLMLPAAIVVFAGSKGRASSLVGAMLALAAWLFGGAIAVETATVALDRASAVAADALRIAADVPIGPTPPHLVEIRDGMRARAAEPPDTRPMLDEWIPTPTDNRWRAYRPLPHAAEALTVPLALVGHLWMLMALALVARDGATLYGALRKSAGLLGRAAGLCLRVSVALMVTRLTLGVLLDSGALRGIGAAPDFILQLLFALCFVTLTAAAIRWLLERCDPPIPEDVFD